MKQRRRHGTGLAGWVAGGVLQKHKATRWNLRVICQGQTETGATLTADGPCPVYAVCFVIEPLRLFEMSSPTRATRAIRPSACSAKYACHGPLNREVNQVVVRTAEFSTPWKKNRYDRTSCSLLIYMYAGVTQSRKY
ncbi:unnamed protein product [Ectocarpus sp. 4 AP-2014]